MNTFIKNNKNLIITFVGVYLILGVLYLLLDNANRASIEKHLTQEAQKVFLQKDTFLKKEIRYIDDKFHAILNNKIFKQYIEKNSNEEYINELFLTSINQSKNIFQLRFLSKDGKERIRVDKNKKDGFIVTKDKLQDKKNRYYFQYAYNMNKKNHLWFSRLDLNIEHDKIEIPHIPTLRVAETVYKKDDTKAGIILVNINMDQFLQELLISEEFTLSLIDKDGYILVSHESQNNWSRYLKKSSKQIELQEHLLSKRLSIENGEGLTIVIDAKPEVIVSLYNEKDFILLISLFLVACVLTFIIYILYSNKNLHLRIDEAIEKERSLNNTLNSYIAMTKTDTEGIITYVSQEFCNITGYEKKDLLGQNHNIVRDSDMPKNYFENLWSTISHGKIYKGDISIVNKNGDRFWFEMEIYPEFDEDKKITGYTSFRKNVTERKHLEEIVLNKTKELQEQNYFLQETNEELATTEEELRAQQEELMENQYQIEHLASVKEQFIANMSHEIRTPLNGIIGMVDMLLDYNQFDQFVLDKVSILKKSSNMLHTIVNDILDYSSLQNGEIKLYPKKFSLRHMIEHLKNTLEPECKEKNLEFKINIAEEFEDTIIADELRLTQILLNLLNNAKKFTHKGYISLSLEVLKKDEVQHYTLITIKDTGIGMTEDVQDRLFEPFNQGDLSRTKEYVGTGLGLVIVKKLIEMMGATVRVNSFERIGTTFKIFINLPYSKEKIDIKEVDEILILSQSKKALLAEDNKINQMVLKGALEKRNFEVSIVSNGLEAVEILKDEDENDFDIVFMDIQMPIMDGLEATQKIKKFDTETPIVAVSAGVLAQNISSSLDAGMDMHIHKPLESRQVDQVLKAFFPNEFVTNVDKKNEQTIFIEGVDIDATSNNLNRDIKATYPLYQKFSNNFANIKEQLEQFKDDKKELQSYVHKLKGVSGILNMKKVYELCKKVDDEKQYQYANDLVEETLFVIENIKSKIIPLIEKEIGEPLNITQRNELIEIYLDKMNNFEFISSDEENKLLEALEHSLKRELYEDLEQSMTHSNRNRILEILESLMEESE